MYNMSNRLNQITFFTGMVLLAFSGLNLFIGQFHLKGEPVVNFNVNQVRRLFNSQQRGWQECWINFEIGVDLTNYLNWNSKFAFVYLNVQFKSQDGKYLSENIIWDSHIQRQLQPTVFDGPLQKYYEKVNLPTNKLNIKNTRHEYALRDVYSSLLGQEVTFQVWVEVTPIIGNIFREKIYETPYTLPKQLILRDP
ncbi:hypothetical protein ABPG74_013493 [Tetrahymena malaccensis]